MLNVSLFAFSELPPQLLPPSVFSRMFASLLNLFGDWDYLLFNPVVLAITIFQIWMLVHAVWNKEWMWALFIFIGYGFGAFWYYFTVYRESASSGFELPGAQSR